MSNNNGWRTAVAGLLLGAAFAGPDAATAQEWEPEFVYAVLQPLPDGFPAGPITVIAAGDEDSIAGLLAQRLSEYSRISTPVEIKVEYRPDFDRFGSWEALKHAAEAEGGAEGYLNVIFASPDDLITLHTAPVAKDVGVGLDDLAEVVSLEDHRYAVIQCPNADWEPTWEALVQRIRERPGEVRYAGGAPGDRADMVFAHYLNALGIGSLYDAAVISHAETGDIAARTDAVAACEGDVTVSNMEQLITEQKSDKVSVLLVTGGRKVAKFKDAPTAVDAGFADDAMSRTMQVVVPASVDPLHVRWLNALWSKVGRDSYFKAGRVLDQPVNIANVLDLETSAALNDATNAQIEAVARVLGIAVDP